MLSTTVVCADKDEDEVFTATQPAWKTECGSCHIPYPPALLPADSWRAVMTGLDKHFGSDATLDEPTTAEITAFLVRHAGRNRRTADGKPSLRITETAWFHKEHDSEIPPAVWSLPQVKPARCEACHTRAADGDFSENTLKIPRY